MLHGLPHDVGPFFGFLGRAHDNIRGSGHVMGYFLGGGVAFRHGRGGFVKVCGRLARRLIGLIHLCGQLGRGRCDNAGGLSKRFRHFQHMQAFAFGFVQGGVGLVCRLCGGSRLPLRFGGAGFGFAYQP